MERRSRRPGAPKSRTGTAITVAGVLGLVAGACGDDSNGNGRQAADAAPLGQCAVLGELESPEELELPPPDPDVRPVPDALPDPDLADLDLMLTEIASLDQPVALAGREGDDALFVAEREGRVYRLEPEAASGATYTPDSEPLVDIGDELVLEGEQGLGGMTFSPDGERLYLSYTAAPVGDARIVSYEYADGSDPGVDQSSRREVLTVEEPYNTHNNGQILFGPDGYLYVGLGDGGHIGDPHGFGQDPTRLLGTVLRIDPEAAIDGGGEAGGRYEIPDDNPFVESQDGCPEIWLYGVRNPWRFSFDSATGDLWLGDVGQQEREEINFLPADAGAGKGANLGWSEMEGSQPFEGGSEVPDAVLPVYDFPNHRQGGDGGCAVQSGYVYRGAALAELEGRYLFGDFCNPQIRALTVEDGEAAHHTPLWGVEVEGLVSLGEDLDGEVYFLAETGSVFRLDPSAG